MYRAPLPLRKIGEGVFLEGREGGGGSVHRLQVDGPITWRAYKLRGEGGGEVALLSFSLRFSICRALSNTVYSDYPITHPQRPL